MPNEILFALIFLISSFLISFASFWLKYSLNYVFCSLSLHLFALTLLLYTLLDSISSQKTADLHWPLIFYSSLVGLHLFQVLHLKFNHRPVKESVVYDQIAQTNSLEDRLDTCPHPFELTPSRITRPSKPTSKPTLPGCIFYIKD